VVSNTLPQILIADDQQIVREGVCRLISKRRPEWGICGQAGDGQQALEAIQALNPDIVILDISMPKASGLEVAAKVSALHLRTRVLMFTMHESHRLADDARAVGAQGLVLKSQAARDLIRAIDRLLAGETFFERDP
jgi:DNA-binding NarL/FixJ family response regulator